MSRSRPIVMALVATVITPAGASSASTDPLCLGSYGTAPVRTGAPVRFGIDPGIAGSLGGSQLPSVPDDPVRDLAAVKVLQPPGRELVVRLNRLFWSEGDGGIARFQNTARAYTRAGFDVELQVRYHPGQGQAGDIGGWERYVRHVVDSFGANPRVVAMTITNEVNVQFSPNTSDGSYAGATDALIGGIEAAHDEALRRRFHQLRFGFTYAYRFLPTGDAGLFAYLGAHGGASFRRALSFVGLDFYPGTFYPPVMLPGDSYSGELAQAAGVLRGCLAPMAGIGFRVPIWITENGVPTGLLTETQQAAALADLVRATHAYSGTFNLSDYRWFNLRDSISTGLTPLLGLSFASDGLLRSDYAQKPSFGTYRQLIAELGEKVAKPPAPRKRTKHRKSGRHRRACHHDDCRGYT